jgi:hypothetical protein
MIPAQQNARRIEPIDSFWRPGYTPIFCAERDQHASFLSTSSQARRNQACSPRGVRCPRCQQHRV